MYRWEEERYSHVEASRRDADVPMRMLAEGGLVRGLVARGEGVPHPRNNGAFPRKLGRHARDQGVIEPGFAVRSMTQLSASVMGLSERGRLQPGAAADLVVFDLDEVHDPATFRAPHQLAAGMMHVLVNGRPAIRDGAFAGGLHGRVLPTRSE